MSPITRGFRRRHEEPPEGDRLPPGQYLTRDFPVLSAGPTPDVPLDEWELSRHRRGRRAARLELGRVPGAGDRAADRRHPLRHVVDEARHDVEGRIARHAARRDRAVRRAISWPVRYGGYTTNLPLEDLLDGKAWIAYGFDGAPLEPEHGGPARLLVPHLYFWKSAKWITELEISETDEPGFWETLGYHNYGDPWREQRYWGD